MTRDRERGQLYGAQTDRTDGEAFEARGTDDRHQFRIILSPEDANELEDLRSFTREFMAQMERDLGTRLDWVAVDHWDTDDPHTHIVIRGKD
ncbi:relaxase/mobilization nuclease domain-containing protein, partial [Staphylococcus aureus]